MPFPLSSLPEQHCVHDVIVIGAGAAGMGVALCAAAEGARVLLVESTPLLGGTSALSAGTTWVPGTRHAAEVGQADSIETAESFLSRAIGDRTAAILRRTLLENGPQAIDFIEANSDLKFRVYPLHPDYLSELEGSALKGRALEPLPFDGRLLGPLLPFLRPPIPEFTVLGLGLVFGYIAGRHAAQRAAQASA
jgi:succinate dehydrogenase/fumarate reductase flavoprotein subunit